MANNTAVSRALVAGAAMVVTLVFCGSELLFALNAWLAGASETQGAFAYLALGKLEPLPYPPSLVIQRNLIWLALAFFVGPAVLFRRFVRPALAAATLLLFASVILDIALGASTLKPEPSVGFSWDMLARGLAGLGSLLALLTYEGEPSRFLTWGNGTRGLPPIDARVLLLLACAALYLIALVAKGSFLIPALEQQVPSHDLAFIDSTLSWRALLVLGLTILGLVSWARDWHFRTIMAGLAFVSLANLGFDIPLYLMATASSAPTLFALMLLLRLSVVALLIDFALRGAAPAEGRPA
jgi:hypothetical protein